MIRAVIFDFGNVICRFDNGIILKRLSDHTGRSVEELQEIVHRSLDVIRSYEKGLISPGQFFKHIASVCGIRMSEDEFIRAYTDKFTPIPETLELIRRLKGKYKLGLLSNTSEWDFEHGIKTTEVFPLFDAVTVSFQVHALKPAREIYADAMAKLGVQPDECQYIDDIEQYAEAARRLGMTGIQYRSHADLVASLNRYLGVEVK